MIFSFTQQTQRLQVESAVGCGQGICLAQMTSMGLWAGPGL